MRLDSAGQYAAQRISDLLDAHVAVEENVKRKRSAEGFRSDFRFYFISVLNQRQYNPLVNSKVQLPNTLAIQYYQFQ